MYHEIFIAAFLCTCRVFLLLVLHNTPENIYIDFGQNIKEFFSKILDVDKLIADQTKNLVFLHEVDLRR